MTNCLFIRLLSYIRAHLGSSNILKKIRAVAAVNTLAARYSMGLFASKASVLTLPKFWMVDWNYLQLRNII